MSWSGKGIQFKENTVGRLGSQRSDDRGEVRKLSLELAIPFRLRVKIAADRGPRAI